MNTAAKACGSVREIPGRTEALEHLSAFFASRSAVPAQALLVLVDEAAWSLEAGDPAAADRALETVYQSLVHWAPLETRAYRWSATSLLLVQAAGATPLSPPLSLRGRAKRFTLSGFRSCGELARAIDSWIGRSLFEPAPGPEL